MKRKRRVIIKAAVFRHPGRAPKNNPRFVVTSRKTVLNEFYRVAFRKKLYRTLEELQGDLDTWLREYNEA